MAHTWFGQSDEIKMLAAAHLKTKATDHWLSILEPAGVWCARVLNWPELLKHEAFLALRLIQSVECANGETLFTTRCPVRIDGQILNSPVGAPRTGEHTRQVLDEFGADERCGEE